MTQIRSHRRPARGRHRAPTHHGRYALAAILALSLTFAAGFSQPAHAQQQESRQAANVVVRAGQTLSGISWTRCGNASWWPTLYAANRSVIGGNPNLIFPGQRLTVSCAVRTQTRASRSTTRSQAWVSPLARFTTTSCYGMRWGSLHAGVDLAAPHGTPIRAVAAGTVTKAGWIWSGYGISVVISHGSGVWSHSAHMSSERVTVGQKVSAGQVIGRVGATGDATGPHVHLEVARRASILGGQVNPAAFLRSHGVRVGC